MDIAFEGVRARREAFELSADFVVPSGAAVAVIGPSGAGKSTLLDLVAGFLAPEAGLIRLGGQDVTRLGPAERPVSMVFQDHNLFPHLTLERNVALGVSPRARPGRAALERAREAMAQVGLSGLERRLPGDVSGGQQGRAALARALLRDRPVLLLDEPFAALGPALRHEMLDLVARLRAASGMTLLMVSHDPADARRIADLAVFVADGRAEAPRATRELLDDPPPALAAYLGSG